MDENPYKAPQEKPTDKGRERAWWIWIVVLWVSLPPILWALLFLVGAPLD